MDLGRVFDRFEDPFIAPVVADVVPPPEAHEQAACHVLDGPKVKGEEEDAHYADEDEVGGEEAAEKVEEDGQGFEDEVEGGGDRVLLFVFLGVCVCV